MTRRVGIRFKGWDWTELLQLRQIAGKNWPKVPRDLKYKKEEWISREDFESSYIVKTYLGGLCYNEGRIKERKLAAKYVRKFCLKLASYGLYDASVYAGMAKIKNDEVLFGWVMTNLECMWT